MNIKFFHPKNPKMCDPEILVTLLKMQPHYGQSSRENATPSSGTYPVVSYKEVPPAPHSGLYRASANNGTISCLNHEEPQGHVSAFLIG